MKKFLIPLAAICIVGIIALLTWTFVLRDRNEDTGDTISIYMVKPNDEGKSGKKIGCGDSLVPVTVESQATVELTDIYYELLGQKKYDFNKEGLKNPLWQSELTLDSATVDSEGVARVSLSGTIKQSGKCDPARIKAQLEEPALTYPGVNNVDVQINGKPIDQAISAQ